MRRLAGAGLMLWMTACGGGSSGTPDSAVVVDAAMVVIDAAATADGAATDGAVPDGATAIDARVIDGAVAIDARVIDGAMADASNPGPGPSIGGCPVFPATDPWNLPQTGAIVDTAWTAKLLANANRTVLHPDFGTAYGIPINVLPQTQPGVTISFTYASESDPGPYPFPASVSIEGGTPTACSGDCHVLVVQMGVCTLWEAWDCHYTAATSSWRCGSGAKFDLNRVGPGQRMKGWTSADAAGLAITPGLVRYAEVAAGEVKHAIRFTMHCTQDGFVAPASHQAVPRFPNGCPQNIADATLRAEYPPMGTRIRLKSSYVTTGLPLQARIIADAMKTYGMILADNGSDWFFQGDRDPGWNDTQLNALKAIPADQFEVLTMPTIER